MIYFSQLIKITGGKNLLFNIDYPIESISIDSRKVSPQKETLFCAIKGERHDGHAYLSTLYHQGMRQFMVELPVSNLEDFPDANILQVPATVEAIQKLVAFHRKAFSYPVIGVTGSNGKTIIKEWLFQMLSHDRIVVKNPGSYNSQVGVPLSVWQMQSHHEIGVFEAGISKPGEMENLERVIKPTIGIFTNVGSAHDEGFLNGAEKIEEKLKLFRNSQVIIYCADHEAVSLAIQKTNIKAFSWGFKTDADVKISIQGNACYISYDQKHHTIQLPFADQASVENCLHCLALMLYLGYPFKKIQHGINSLRSVAMRMEMKEGINQCYIIDDTYNNDLGGLEISIQFLTHQNQKKKKTANTL